MKLPLMKNCRIDRKSTNNIIFTVLVDFTDNDSILFCTCGHETSIKKVYGEFKFRATNMDVSKYCPFGIVKEIKGVKYRNY